MSSLGRRWAHAFADPSGEAFAALVSPAVELDGCVFARPLHGRHAALTALATAAGIYDAPIAARMSRAVRRCSCDCAGCRYRRSHA
jgi:hypothetical protein